MPSTLVEVRRPREEHEEVALLEAVQAALVAGFRIPEADRNVRLVVHAPHRWVVKPGLAQPDLFTLVTVDCIAGRSADAKRRLYREVVTRLAALGVPEDHVTVVVRDLPAESWGIRGGRAASDVDLGFAVDV